MKNIANYIQNKELINGLLFGLGKTTKENEIYMKLLVGIFTAYFILIYTACDPYDIKLKIVNSTHDTIFLDISKTGKFESHPIYVDEINRKDTVWNFMTWINPMDSLSVPAIGNSWEGSINKDFMDSTLTIFVFEKKLLKNTSRDSLLANQIYSRKYAFKVSQLQKMKWRIIFD